MSLGSMLEGMREVPAALCGGVDGVWTCRMDCPHHCERAGSWLRASTGALQQAIQMVGAGLSLVTQDPEKCLVGGHVKNILTN